jgi:excisionase family DNA binding protein
MKHFLCRKFLEQMPSSFSDIDTFFDKVLFTLDKLSRDVDFIKSKYTNDKIQNQLYTPKEVARLLKCSDRTIYNMIWNGSLATIRVGRKIFIQAEILEKLKKNGTRANK